MFLIPPNQEQKPEQKEPAIVESPKLKNLQSLDRLGWYGFAFCSGITLAHVVRISRAWILYLPTLLVGAYLMFIRPNNVTDSDVSLRRIGGVCLVLGTLIAWWDAIALLFHSPIVLSWWLFNLVLPMWLVVLAVLLLIAMRVVNR